MAVPRRPPLGIPLYQSSIAVAGTILGLGLAWLGVRQLLAIAPPNLPRFDTIRLDPVTLAYTAVAGLQPQERAALVREIQGRLRALPGVENVSACTPFPLSGYSNSMRWGVEQAMSDPSKAQTADYQMVIPGYFETMRMRLLAGRTFTETDNAPERKVVIINEFLATKAFPNKSAVGKRILINLPTLEPELVEVIGVVGHQRITSLAEPGREQ